MIEGASKPVPVVLHRTVPQARVLVAIPAFNESTTIGSVVLKARQFATDIVVIDDGSTDDTAEVAIRWSPCHTTPREPRLRRRPAFMLRPRARKRCGCNGGP